MDSHNITPSDWMYLSYGLVLDFTTYLCFTWSIFSTSLTYKRVSKQRFFCKAKSCNEPTLILFNHSNKRMYCKIQDAQKHPIQAISQ